MGVSEHGDVDGTRRSRDYVDFFPWEAYGWALARLRERPKQVLALLVVFAVTGPSFVNQTYLALQADPPATVLLANAALWLPVMLVVQVVAYRNTGIVAGAYDARDLPLRTALSRTPQLLALGLAVAIASSLLVGLVGLVVGFAWSLLGPLLTLLLSIPAAVLAIPRVFRLACAATMAFPAAVVDGGVLEAIGLGWDAGAEAPYTTAGVLCIGAVPIAAMQVLAGAPGAHWIVFGVAIGLWTTVATVALGRTYVSARPSAGRA